MPGRWLENSELQRAVLDSPGAEVERLVPYCSCAYCGAEAHGRCRTKSGAVDPLYHHDRWLAANQAHGEGKRIAPWK